jgi:hypothetical protein
LIREFFLVRAELSHAGEIEPNADSVIVKQMNGKTNVAAGIASYTVATSILLLPAIWNRFPILEYDTGGYLARWFEGYLVPARSTTYGLFLFAGWPLDFWPNVILQAVAAVWIVDLLLRVHRFDGRVIALPVIVAVLSLLTAMPWLASELLTDICAGLAVLAFHALVWHGDRIGRIERFALVLFIAFAGSTHSATLAVLIGLTAVAVAVSSFRPVLVPRRRLGSAVATLGLGVVMLLGANYALSKTLAWTPGGYGIAFGRMLQDGIVARYLSDHCPDPRLKLCPYRDQLPRNADVFLWGASVFDKLGRFVGLEDEMRFIVLDSLLDYPTMQIETALRSTAQQLMAVATGEGVVTTIFHTYGIIERYTPSVAPAMHAARQQRGELTFRAVNEIHVPVARVAMALLPFVMAIGFWNAEFADLGWLAASIMLALFGNAAFCGVISDPHDRYGSRIVWIAAFGIGLAVWRAVIFALKRATVVASESASTA